VFKDVAGASHKVVRDFTHGPGSLGAMLYDVVCGREHVPLIAVSR
jgi:hypothetical protein